MGNRKPKLRVGLVGVGARISGRSKKATRGPNNLTAMSTHGTLSSELISMVLSCCKPNGVVRSGQSRKSANFLTCTVFSKFVDVPMGTGGGKSPPGPYRAYSRVVPCISISATRRGSDQLRNTSIEFFGEKDRS